VCLDGDLPSKEFFSLGLPVVAADGAANKLVKMDVIPEAIVGDLDSINLRGIDIAKTKVIHLPDQNTCDFQKSIEYIKEKCLFPAVITGVNGGYIDHILNNISVFSQLDECLFFDKGIIGLVLKAHRFFQIQIPIFSKLSVFGVPEAVISTIGLKWNLNKDTLKFFVFNSCFNRSVSEEISFEVHVGRALILFYTGNIIDGFEKK
jgi:thiamine pyrophosphokinase